MQEFLNDSPRLALLLAILLAAGDAALVVSLLALVLAWLR